MTKRLRVLIPALLLGACAKVLGITPPVPRSDPDSGGTGDPSGSVTDAGRDEERADGGTADADRLDPAEAPDRTEITDADGPCAEGARRCGGRTGNTPEVCDSAGEWLKDSTETTASGCPLGCVNGRCAECRPGEARCVGNVPESCEDGRFEAGIMCASYCAGGACINPPSCESSLSCGDSVSCCRALGVPGGDFIRDYDGVSFTDRRYQATLSSFLLDEFEVTVGRMRNFVQAYPDLELEPGDGKAPHIGSDLGWNPSYPLPHTRTELQAMLTCPDGTWTPDQSGDETLPINCVDYFVAYAFCIWDGGRLPTEAEWNYAAAGGHEQRVYPWSSPPGDPTIGNEHATFERTGGLPLPVGSKPLGNARWGHADLGGNVYEWNLDFYANPYRSDRCIDCMEVTGTGSRVLRGGGYRFPRTDLRVAIRSDSTPNLVRAYAGFRCARDRIDEGDLE